MDALCLHNPMQTNKGVSKKSKIFTYAWILLGFTCVNPSSRYKHSNSDKLPLMFLSSYANIGVHFLFLKVFVVKKIFVSFLVLTNR